jgi:magnesium transporter
MHFVAGFQAGVKTVSVNKGTIMSEASVPMPPADNIHHARAAAIPRDEKGHISADFLDQVSLAIEAGDASAVKELAGDLHEADAGELIAELAPEYRAKFVELLGVDFDFAALTELDETVRVELIGQLSTPVIAEGVRDLDSDDAIYILEDLEQGQREEILELLPPPERVALTRGLDFPEDSAGRRMQTDFIAIPPFWTVGQVVDFLRVSQDLPDEFYEIHVVDPAYKLVGTIALDTLLRSQRDVRVDAILHEDRHVVSATLDQEDVARLFQRYNLISAPVLDEHERLVGVLTIDDIVDVIQEEADEDIRALGGVVGDEEISDKFIYTAKSRLPWLVINLFMAFISVSVINFFNDSIERMVALAILMPIVASMGGNAGTQAMTVTVRALSARELGGRSARRVVRREVLVGLVNGSILAIVLGIIAALWFSNMQLGVVIATALVVNMITAGFGGVCIPLLLHRLKADPAVASAVFLTTLTDTVGFFLFLGLASWWFGL